MLSGMAKPSKDRGNQKVQPRLSPLMHKYLDDLLGVAFYGKTKTQVAQRLIEDGIKAAIRDNLIKVRSVKIRKPKKKS